jgi:hypothetical protein
MFRECWYSSFHAHDAQAKLCSILKTLVMEENRLQNLQENAALHLSHNVIPHAAQVAGLSSRIALVKRVFFVLL